MKEKKVRDGGLVLEWFLFHLDLRGPEGLVLRSEALQNKAEGPALLKGCGCID